MDWNAAIEKNQEALKRILAALVAMAGLAGGDSGTLPCHLHRAVLRLLRPAEAATRRLVIVAARGIAVAPLHHAPPAPSRCRFSIRFSVGRAVHVAPPAACRASRFPASPSGFPSRHHHPATRSTPHGLAAGSQHWPRHSTTCRHRPGVSRAGGARDAIIAQNRNRDAAAQTGETRHLPHRQARPCRLWPLRPGCPPGWRRKPEHEVHEVLNNTHGLAFWALERRDTS
jgi:hypothetical protein